MIINDKDLGRIQIESVPLPEELQAIQHPIYTASGSIVFGYRLAEDQEDKDYLRIGCIEDDGSLFRTIYSGSIPMKRTGNGLRLMPFADNKRILFGDYILEATPSLTDATEAQLIPVIYPDALMNNPIVTHHWSEIVISPDNRHMAWTTLVTGGAINFLGTLKRHDAHYSIDQVTVISTTDSIVADPDNPGFHMALPMRGGEIKQFIRNGEWLSLAGTTGRSMPDSVIQSLTDESLEAITHLPSYEETTIFSPDERLGIVMSTRGSAKTNLAIYGLMPRPYANLINLAQHAYLYSIAAVRFFRQGNIGPVLIDIERSKHEPDYRGVQLNDPEEQWVYHSPMSWHPSSQATIWPEGLRGTRQMRIRIARLLDYQPAATVTTSEAQTPDITPYSIALEDGLASAVAPALSVTFKGRVSGTAQYDRGENVPLGQAMTTSVVYSDYCDDGETVYNGFERVSPGENGTTVYEAQLRATREGQDIAEMDLRLCFGAMSFTSPAHLIFDADENGKAQTRGFSRCADTVLYAADLA